MFQPTQWSLVLAAARSHDPAGEVALAKLCTSYWRPLYAYVRSRGYAAEDAQDLTQAFFLRLIEGRFFRRARRERGRFRTFLIVSLKHFLANEWDRATAQKRGGGVLSVDFEEAERSLVAREADANPERSYERQWVQRVLEATLARVREQYVASGQEATFEALKHVLADGRQNDASYRDLASELGLSEGAVRVAVHRLRQRYRASLRAIVGETLGDPSDVDDEIRYLLSVLAGG
jgi:RNA polymerase sigma factor (sigma-70 family)